MARPELLAPAGDLERLKVAIRYGADAVYLGGKSFSLRARASNFTLADIAEGVRHAHARGARVYVTTNILPRPGELDGFCDYLAELERIGIDGLICASPGIIQLALQHSSLPVHVSTQQSLTNSEAVNFWYSRGVERVILARELSLEEIRTLRARTGVELEAFVHGGMCASYSGKCTLSNTLAARDANRGGCAHSCRWAYELLGPRLESRFEDAFSLSAKDLQAIQEVPELYSLGIDALKIEGRMKSVHYVATVVNTYRRLIDTLHAGEPLKLKTFLEEIAKAENRPTASGHLRGTPTRDAQLFSRDARRPIQRFAALVRDYDTERGEAVLEQRSPFRVGDTLEVLSPDLPGETITISELRDEAGIPIAVARHPRQRLRLRTDVALKPYDILRKQAPNSIATTRKT